MNNDPSMLEAVLLGLLSRAPASGYELRKVLQGTPLARYSDSPGAVYPALRRLAGRGLAQAGSAEGGRRRQAWQLTEQGAQWLREWLAAPLTAADLSADTATVDLRLAMLSDALPERLPSFLREYAAALAQQLAVLERARTALAQDLSRSAGLALDLGIAMFRARRQWCEDAARGHA